MADRKDKLATPHDSKDTLKQLVKGVATKTDLADSTVRDLLTNGWKFVQELGKPDRWIKEY